MKKIVSLLMFLATSINLYTYAQSNNSDSTSQKPASKNSSVDLEFTKEGDKWHAKIYDAQTHQLRQDSWYADADAKVLDGPVVTYNSSGIMIDSSFYKSGWRKARYLFYEDHSIAGYAFFMADHFIEKQGGFTKDGQKITDYIFEKNAECDGGNAKWTEYISKEIENGLTKVQKKEARDHEVVVTFYIQPDGSLTDISIQESGGLEWLDEHSLNLIKRCKLIWHPAIFNNKPVKSRWTFPLYYPSGVIRMEVHQL